MAAAGVFWGGGRADEVADFDEYDPTPYGGGYPISTATLRGDLLPDLHRHFLRLLVRPSPAGAARRPEARRVRGVPRVSCRVRWRRRVRGGGAASSAS